MATSNKCGILKAAVLVVFATIALNLLQPSVATTRVIRGGAVKAGAIDQEAAASGGGAQPNDCRQLLTGMMPCAGFLNNPRVFAPDRACCAGFNAMFQTDAITCVCHVVNGDINQLLPAPMLRQHARMVRLFASCGHNVPVDRFAGMCRATVVPPIDAQLPQPSPSFPQAPDAPLPPSPTAPSMPSPP